MKSPWIEGKNFHNFHWTKKTNSRKGHEKLGGDELLGGFFSCVVFPGRRRSRMMNLSRWWKEGD